MQKIEQLLSKAKKKRIGLYPAYWDQGFELMSEKFRIRDVTAQFVRKMQDLIDGTCNRSALGSGVDQKQQGQYSGLDVIKV